jgi:peptide-methionine (R)-S-oxide reductase
MLVAMKTLMNRRHQVNSLLLGTGLAALGGRAAFAYEIEKSDAAWRAQLSPATYKVLRQADTELPYSSPLNNEHRKGVFACAGCRLDLFSSATKFESHTGWPSFWRPLPHAIGTSRDFALGMARTEVHCARCGGHLGHVFNDGPRPTGLRYCMNSAALRFVPEK